MNFQEHLFTVTGEECAEVAQMCSKINRFGISEIFPEQPLTNAERMHLELDDLQAMIEMLNQHCDFRYLPNRERIEAKKQKVLKYAEYSRQLGLINQIEGVK